MYTSVAVYRVTACVVVIVGEVTCSCDAAGPGYYTGGHYLLRVERSDRRYYPLFAKEKDSKALERKGMNDCNPSLQYLLHALRAFVPNLGPWQAWMEVGVVVVVMTSNPVAPYPRSSRKEHPQPQVPPQRTTHFSPRRPGPGSCLAALCMCKWCAL
jgi:hypothetical protein